MVSEDVAVAYVLNAFGFHQNTLFPACVFSLRVCGCARRGDVGVCMCDHSSSQHDPESFLRP